MKIATAHYCTKKYPLVLMLLDVSSSLPCYSTGLLPCLTSISLLAIIVSTFLLFHNREIPCVRRFVDKQIKLHSLGTNWPIWIKQFSSSILQLSLLREIMVKLTFLASLPHRASLIYVLCSTSIPHSHRYGSPILPTEEKMDEHIKNK